MPKTKPIQLIGMFLWRGGLLLAFGYSTVHTCRWLLRFIDVPATVAVGLALTLAGMVLVLASVVAERVQDARKEKEVAQ